MQLAKFEDGSIVAHKVRLDGMASRFSVWADRFGNIRDAERIDSRGRSYPVPRGSTAWGRLESRIEMATAIRSGF